MPPFPDASSEFLPTWLTERKRLVPDRFKRIWAITEFIAHHPGVSRSELADAFSLSQRQIQSDLIVMREDLGLPVTRREGYRFQTAAPADLTLREVATLGAMMQQAWQDATAGREALENLAERLPASFPPHLRALARKALEPPEGQSG